MSAAPSETLATGSPQDTIQAGQHIIFRYESEAPGPTLIAIGSLHGNEAAGVNALFRVTGKLQAKRDRICGRVVFLAGNTRALRRGERFIDSDLNRYWTQENITRNRQKNVDRLFSEDLEQTELLEILDDLIATASDEVYILDLHSTSAEGEPFATVGDTMRNRHFVQKFPITILLGIEEQLDGTLLEFLNNRGAVTLGFEAGQHYAVSTIDNHEALVWMALVESKVLGRDAVPEIDHWREVLLRAAGKPRIIEVRYRHPIHPEQNFQMRPGFQNFDPVDRRQLLADDIDGGIYAQEKGLILMPLYQKLGDDGFFLGREVAPFWLWLSEMVRRLDLGRFMHFLPGVRPSLTDADTLEVDTTVARFFPLQIFHLLGFRRLRWKNRKLAVSRRKHDTASPFV